ncbi:MAG: hypothetical protein ACTSQ6_09960 [Candidatus Heimdallarchaeaceae archaeon]
MSSTEEKIEIIEQKIDNLYKWSLTIFEEIKDLKELIRNGESNKSSNGSLTQDEKSNEVNDLNNDQSEKLTKEERDKRREQLKSEGWEIITELLPKNIDIKKREEFKRWCKATDGITYMFDYGKTWDWYIKGEEEKKKLAKAILS